MSDLDNSDDNLFDQKKPKNYDQTRNMVYLIYFLKNIFFFFLVLFLLWAIGVFVEIFILFLATFIFIPLILFMLSYFRKWFDDLNHRILSILVRFKIFHPYILFELQLFTKKNIRNILKDRELHLIFRLEWRDIKLIAKILRVNQRYNRCLCPAGLNLLEESRNDKYSVKSLSAIADFYEINKRTLIKKLLHNKNLNNNELQRVAYETNIDERNFLEKNLSQDHPLIPLLKHDEKITVNDSFAILK